MNLSDQVDEIINHAVEKFDGTCHLEENPFEKLVSMGELVDRLTIVNLKLFTLKSRVNGENKNEASYLQWAAIEDVKLVEERARLKRCLDEKLNTTIARHLSGDKSGGFNPEVKMY